MKINLYHLNNSRSHRIVWMLEELNCHYEIISPDDIEINDVSIAYLPIKYPTLKIQTPDSILFLTESGAIVEFISQYYQSLIPQNDDISKIVSFLFWKNYADGSFMPNLVLKQVFTQIMQKTPIPFRMISWSFKYLFNKLYLDKTLNEQLSRIDNHLSTNTWFANDFSIADILMWFPLEVCYTVSLNCNYPHIDSYIKRIHSREAFQKALIRGNWSEKDFHKYWASAW